MAIERQGRTRAGAAQDGVQARADRPQGHRDQAQRAQDRRAGPRARRHRGRRSRPSSPPTPRASPSTRTGGAGIGGCTIDVDQLASSAQRGYGWRPDASARTLTVAYATTRRRASRSRSRPTRTPPTSRPRSTPRPTSPVYAAVVKNADGDERLVLSRAQDRRRQRLHRPRRAGRGQLTEDARVRAARAGPTRSTGSTARRPSLSSQTNTSTTRSRA